MEWNEWDQVVRRVLWTLFVDPRSIRVRRVLWMKDEGDEKY